MDNPDRTILIVDDTESNVDILVETLADEYEVSVAMSGEDALEILEEERPDLILLDIMMPGMDGYEVCRKLKEMEQAKDIPVIFLSAMTEEKEKKKGLLMGAVDFITKPIDPVELKSKIKSVL